MQWNTAKMSKEELKKRQEEYIKLAIEMSKKSKWKDDLDISDIITASAFENTEKTEVYDKNEAIETDESISLSQLSEETSDNVLQDVQQVVALKENDSALLTEDFKEMKTAMYSPEEIIANIFITEEEAEEKLKEAQKNIEEISEEIPDFNKYIASHNKEASGNNGTADE